MQGQKKAPRRDFLSEKITWKTGVRLPGKKMKEAEEKGANKIPRLQRASAKGKLVKMNNSFE